MGIGALKEELREKIMTYHYQAAEDDIWELLDMYDKYLSFSNVPDELAEAAFLRGDVSFHMGRYHDTVEALKKCLGIEKTPEYAYLEADACNLLGMLFSFLGYEDIALEHYLSAVDSARKKKNIHACVSALLNIGLLYEGLKDYETAMSYYEEAMKEASEDYTGPKMLLTLLCMIQEAQLFCKTGQYDEALRRKREIDSYYHIVMQEELLLSECILEVCLQEYLGETKRMGEWIASIRHFLDNDARYLEQIDSYVEFCAFLVEHGKKEYAREFLDALCEKLEGTEFLRLRMRIEELEVRYQKQYCDQKHYLAACVRYMNLQQEYDAVIRSFHRKNLSNIENLQELEKQRQEFEIQSKCDLATGLLNKESFQQEVEAYLEERKRNVTDAMIMIDIDNFKLINDSFGHLVGDEVIRRLSGLIKDQFARELCGRFGGDEFVIFMKEIVHMEDVEAKVEQMRERFHQIAFGKNRDLYNTISIGVSYNNGVNASYTTMFSCADEALVKAKEYGKDRVAFFEIKRGLLRHVQD